MASTTGSGLKIIYETKWRKGFDLSNFLVANSRLSKNSASSDWFGVFLCVLAVNAAR